MKTDIARATSPTVYRFGDFEFRSHVPELRKCGLHLKLEQKPLLVLAALLEARGEVVGRRELQKKLWPANTFVDFDLGLNVAVRKLRNALCDSADAPKFVERIPGRGYRWIAETQAQDSVPAGTNSAPMPVESPSISSLSQTVLVKEPINTQLLQTTRRINWQLLMWPSLGVLLLSGVALGWWLWLTNQPKLNFAKRDYVLVGEFENRTGETVFEGTCQFALASELSESRFVNVAPPQRVHDVLRLMKRPPTTQLAPEIAREVCLRDGEIRAYLTGRIEKFGDRYQLTAILFEPKSNGIVGTWSEPVAGINDFPRATHRLAQNLRARLGESTADLALTALPKVTTNSLEALRLYAQVDARTDSPLDDSADVEALQRAVELDPDFAMAHIRLAIKLYLDKRVDEATLHFRKARQLSAALPDYERLSILGIYYELYNRDLPRAIATYTELVRLYPDDFWGINHLFRLTGRSDLAYREADIRPSSLRANMFAWIKAMEANDPAEQRFYERASRLVNPESLELNSDCTVMKFVPAYRALARQDLQAAQAEAQKASREFSSLGPRARDSLAFFLGTFYAYTGQLHVAEYWYNQMPTMQRTLGLAQLADARHEPGYAQRWARVIAATVGTPDEDADADFRLAYFGNLKQVSEASGFADWNHGEDRILQAEAELVQKHRNKAIQLLREELANSVLPDERVAATALLSRILEDSGDRNGAVEVLQSLNNSSVWPGLNVSVWPIELRFHLAQLYRMRGDNAEAFKVEAELRSVLANADSDYWIAQQLQASALTSQHR